MRNLNIALRVYCGAGTAKEAICEASNHPSTDSEYNNVARGEPHVCYYSFSARRLTVVARLGLWQNAGLKAKQNKTEGMQNYKLRTRLD